MYQKSVLDNGLRVITGTMPYTRAVCINIFISAGSRYEGEDESGTSHFIEHLCFKGTERRADAREIAEAIEGVGGMLNGGTDKEFTFTGARWLALTFLSLWISRGICFAIPGLMLRIWNGSAV